ncbi:MAG: hypothetical protein A2Y03_00745 [Omnitrophica WOR_2 bacterium GWF2_38_59]|nr:MAG: hypothetical protein A2Y03_00745 [Omnitrophica WOR_2 bacterium GWF2_38_59]OGX46883.1 MAG: hypothetical protein A2243_11865 [Omnitrophica WOR_2 bacterium RIFOXYA2_FULL_38_17]OGX52607.1 MAG: hypothetical protein A2267_03830 [Omnitrophica WOR_2 bacterium RIFOXYA12_FULL_38_10]OGX55501.1 MAG: hypothetical protein A2447_05745 [Omnitrophica WOR_2 bacterium RIFOXYC2_FULL_38_12]OGX58502.1 MAG: hypothetical protein A2306_03700 [Omnitrophica WOR_2 bacterium RIFOXYB2_FULL_38_16]HBG60585.1 hypothet
MNKENILKSVETLVKEGQLTKEELLGVYDRSISTDKQETLNKQSRISNILYYIGGGIVFLGVCIFIGTNWSELNDLTKIIATLGTSVMMYYSGVLLTRYKNLERICDAFYFLAALVAPLGIFVTMDIAGIDTGTAGCHTVIAAILLVVNLVSYNIDKRNVFFVFSVIFGSWLFFSLTIFMIGGRPFSDWNFVKYRWLVAGLSHMILGYALRDTDKKGLTRYLYGFGVVEFLTAALCLGGYTPNQNVFWELIFPGLTFGIIFLSVYLRSRSFLIFGTLYLMFYLFKITGEYFTSGFGWAFSLIIVGFALMGIGYFAFYLNKKYIS